jgi:hypothetical protein
MKICALLILCALGCDDGGDPAGTIDAGPIGCTYESDCEWLSDCRCRDGTIWKGRDCTDGACLTDRHAFCEDACGDHGGWTPNPEGCWEWAFLSTGGTGADYTWYDEAVGCASGYAMYFSRPDTFAPDSIPLFCIPASLTCASDADCAGTTALTSSGQALSCSPEVTSPTTGNVLRFCFWADQTPCGVWGD